jgi:cation:H+ antiporter
MKASGGHGAETTWARSARPTEVAISSLPLPPLLIWAFVLLASLAVLVKGSDWFTAAAERIGLALGLPSFLVGVTIVAFGTSLPELISSILAVLRGASEIVAGNVVGSNVTNLLLILGLAAVVGGHLRVRYELVSVDLPFLAGSAFFLALVLWNGEVSRPEGALCLAGIGLYVWYAMASKAPIDAALEVREAALAREPRWLRSSAILLGSGGLIYLGADYTVEAVVRISTLLGVGAEVIAASAVALGTSLPEVAVTVVAARRGQPELAVGNVLGSNVFNAFGVVGVSALVGPLRVPRELVTFAVPLMVVATLLAFFMIMEKEMTKWEGWLAILFYVYYLGALFNLL